MLRASRYRKVDSKSNEITAVPELLDTLHLDAMGCQKDDTLLVLSHKRPFVRHGLPSVMADFCYVHMAAAVRTARNVSVVAVGPMRGQAKRRWPPSA